MSRPEPPPLGEKASIFPVLVAKPARKKRPAFPFFNGQTPWGKKPSISFNYTNKDIRLWLSPAPISVPEPY